ncbi:MAG: hypothetical protein U9N73_03660 [Candidatus Auribacterota bacterium]|nr:hypothetical protein [Candidatus Auribacterota bacterium]
MKFFSTIKVSLGISLAIFMIMPLAATGEEIDQPILLEQKIVQISLDAENQDGIDWNLFQLYQRNRKTTTGFFPLSERARNRLDFRSMKKNIPPEQAENSDFENVEQTRVNQFEYGPIWEDTRSPRKITEDTHFGSLRVYNFKNVMKYLRTLGQAKVIFNRKWGTENGQQSMISSQPEMLGQTQTAEAPAIEWWEGSRLTIRPEIIAGRRISFHLNSEIATSFYVDPAFNPGLPVFEWGGKQVARLWRLYRLTTVGLVESGETAVFEDIRDGNGVLIFLTPYILESHRKQVNR